MRPSIVVQALRYYLVGFWSEFDETLQGQEVLERLRLLIVL
jgi:hypothetical protein